MNDVVLDPAVVDRLRQLTPTGEPDVLANVLSLFLQEGRRRIGGIHLACRTGDAAEVHRVAHSLKGSAGNIGATALYLVCREIDDRASEGDMSGAALLVEALDREYARVEAEIARLMG